MDVSSDILLALPGNVLSVKTIPVVDTRGDLGCEALLVITKESVLVISIDGRVLSTISISDRSEGNNVEVTNAAFMLGISSIMVSLSDNTLVHVPLMTATSTPTAATGGGGSSSKRSVASNIDISSYERFKWSKPITSLSCIGKSADGRVMCLVSMSDSSVAVVLLNEDSSNPTMPSEISKKIGNIILSGGTHFGRVAALVLNSKKKYELLTWSNFQETGWLSPDTSESCILSIIDGEYDVSSLHVTSICTYVVLNAKDDSKECVLVKCASDCVLFTRELGRAQKPAYAEVLESKTNTEIILFGLDGKLTSWCGRYGSPGAAWKTSGSVGDILTSTDEPVKARTSKRGRDTGNSADALQSLNKNQRTKNHSDYVIGGVPGNPSLFCIRCSSGGSSLVRVTLVGKQVKPTGLLNALGVFSHLDKQVTPIVVRMFEVEEETSAQDKESHEQNSKGKGVLATLPRPLKRKLQQTSQWRARYVLDQDQIESANDTTKPIDSNDNDGSSVKRSKSSTGTTSPPFEACTAFLRELQACQSPDDILASDWDVVLTLLTTQSCVSLQQPHNTSLLDMSLAAGRLDVLCCAARYASDLTEVQAVKALIGLSRWDVASVVGCRALQHLRLGSKGVLEWHAKSIQSENVSTPSSGKASKRKNQAKANKNNEETLPTLGHLDLLRVLTESLLRRSSGFSVPLLSDAIREHASSSTAGLLLHLFLLFLRGLCNDNDAQFFGFVHDQQVARAIDWSESLLDAHFCGVAMSTSSTNSNGMLEGALRAAASLLPSSGLSSGEQSLEQALGAWTHIWRTAKRMKDIADSGHTRATLQPPGGLYRLEKIVF